MPGNCRTESIKLAPVLNNGTAAETKVIRQSGSKQYRDFKKRRRKRRRRRKEQEENEKKKKKKEERRRRRRNRNEKRPTKKGLVHFDMQHVQPTCRRKNDQSTGPFYLHVP